MLVCPIRTFRIMRSLKIIKCVQHMLAGGRHVHQWMHKANLASLFVLVTCDTEPYVAFVLRMCDQNATRTGTLTKITSALLPTSRFPFVLIEECLNPKLSVAQVTRNSRSRRYTGGSNLQSLHVFAIVFRAICTTFLTNFTNVSFSHSPCQVPYDVLVSRYLIE